MSNHGRTRSKSALVLALGLFISTTIASPAYGTELDSEAELILNEELQTITIVTSPDIMPSASRDSSTIHLPSASVSSTPNRNVPISFAGGSLLDAARAQIGVGQDCTAMVENALRMLGYSVGDVGPMGFASFGVSIDPSEAQEGDIMMRGSHVAIYAGGGSAVHGGYNGSTVETTRDSNPYSYAVIVRVQ